MSLAEFIEALRTLANEMRCRNDKQYLDYSEMYERFGMYATKVDKLIVQLENCMLLYPDMSRTTYDGSETFVFAAPCTKDEWYSLLRDARCINDGIRLPYIVAGQGEDTVCIILRREYSTDDEAVETAAWIRVSQENFNGMIYAMHYVDTPQYGSVASIIARTAGANPKQVKHIDLTKELT